MWKWQPILLANSVVYPPARCLILNISECTPNWIRLLWPRTITASHETESLQRRPIPNRLWLVCCDLYPEFPTTQMPDQTNRRHPRCTVKTPKLMRNGFKVRWEWSTIIHNILRLTPNKLNCSSVTLLTESGKNVASTNILHNCVNTYIPPAWMHFQKAPYSDLENKIDDFYWFLNNPIKWAFQCFRSISNGHVFYPQNDWNIQINTYNPEYLYVK